MQFNQTNANGGDVVNVLAPKSTDEHPEAGPGQVRILRITNALLCKLLNFPEGTRIEGFNIEQMFGNFRPDLQLKISHPAFSAVESGAMIPAIWPRYQINGETGRTEFKDWGN